MCARVVVVEPVAMRRELALSLGADAAIDLAQDDAIAAIKALTQGGGAHAA